MNILFLTIGRMESIESHSIYSDLMRCFRDNGHDVYIVSPREKRTGLPTKYSTETGVHMLQVCIGNITKCNIIEKGISTILIESQYKKAIKRYLNDVKFDLVIYSTPPITFAKVVEYVKKRDDAKSYLLLKDIFPQNSVDIGLLNTTGLKGLIYRFFRIKEKKLYRLSDYIGCMSMANVDYVINHNPEIRLDIVEVCPNSIEVIDTTITYVERNELRAKYGIPADKVIFVYGGNLGRPQGIVFVIDCLKACRTREDIYFLIVGDGTEYSKLEEYISTDEPSNVKLLKRLPKDEYDNMIAACDVGLIFLDYRFTIPNFPSRLLSYMQASMPVLAATDVNTDIGKVIENGNFGYWCESIDVNKFNQKLQQLLDPVLREQMGKNAQQYLEDNYTVKHSYETIMNHFIK